jgi:hypothetical protein
MMKNVVFCEVCGVEKKDVNHWWVSAETTLSVPKSGESDPPEVDKVRLISIYEWNDELAVRPGAKHYCGVEHAMKKVSEFLGAQR